MSKEIEGSAKKKEYKLRFIDEAVFDHLQDRPMSEDTYTNLIKKGKDFVTYLTSDNYDGKNTAGKDISAISITDKLNFILKLFIYNNEVMTLSFNKFFKALIHYKEKQKISHEARLFELDEKHFIILFKLKNDQLRYAVRVDWYSSGLYIQTDVETNIISMLQEYAERDNFNNQVFNNVEVITEMLRTYPNKGLFKYFPKNFLLMVNEEDMNVIDQIISSGFSVTMKGEYLTGIDKKAILQFIYKNSGKEILRKAASNIADDLITTAERAKHYEGNLHASFQFPEFPSFDMDHIQSKTGLTLFIAKFLGIAKALDLTGKVLENKSVRFLVYRAVCKALLDRVKQLSFYNEVNTIDDVLTRKNIPKEDQALYNEILELCNNLKDFNSYYQKIFTSLPIVFANTIHGKANQVMINSKVLTETLKPRSKISCYLTNPHISSLEIDIFNNVLKSGEKKGQNYYEYYQSLETNLRRAQYLSIIGMIYCIWYSGILANAIAQDTEDKVLTEVPAIPAIKTGAFATMLVLVLGMRHYYIADQEEKALSWVLKTTATELEERLEVLSKPHEEPELAKKIFGKIVETVLTDIFAPTMKQAQHYFGK